MQQFLVIHTTYQTCDIALFSDENIQDRCSEDKSNTSKQLIPAIDTLLTRHKLSINMLDFIVINQGPGPFSTLRSVIATANGLHCAMGIPLIGIDSLKATLSEFKTNAKRTIVLFNAFNREVYFAIEQHAAPPLTGYKTIETFIAFIEHNYHDETINFIGNAVPLYTQEIKNALAGNAIIPEIIPNLCSLEYLGLLGLDAFNKTHEIQYLFPLYLKKHPVEYT